MSERMENILYRVINPINKFVGMDYGLNAMLTGKISYLLKCIALFVIHLISVMSLVLVGSYIFNPSYLITFIIIWIGIVCLVRYLFKRLA